MTRWHPHETLTYWNTITVLPKTNGCDFLLSCYTISLSVVHVSDKVLQVFFFAQFIVRSRLRRQKVTAQIYFDFSFWVTRLDTVYIWRSYITLVVPWSVQNPQIEVTWIEKRKTLISFVSLQIESSLEAAVLSYFYLPILTFQFVFCLFCQSLVDVPYLICSHAMVEYTVHVSPHVSYPSMKSWAFVGSFRYTVKFRTHP